MEKKKQQIFFPNLDALRFFSFLSVFFYHSFATINTEISSNKVYILIKNVLFQNGILGVNFFFVLSGFLITYLLLAEKSSYKRISIRNFYIRRILRIWPLFFFCVFFGFVIFPILKSYFGQVSDETANPLAYIFFLSNIDMIAKGFPDSSILGILWSVGIEEQFYLLWPLVIGIVPVKRLPIIFSAIILVSFIFRFIFSSDKLMVEYHSISCMSDLTIGGFGAYMAFYSTRFLNVMKNLPKPGLITLYSVAIILYILRKDVFGLNSFTIALDRLVISIIFLMIIMEQNYNRHSLFKLETLKTVSKLGQYTYGLYCLHTIGILIAYIGLNKLGLNNQVWQVLLLEFVVSLAITIFLAYLSYKYLESRFLKLKNKFSIITTGNITENKKPVSGWGTFIKNKIFAVTK